VATRFERLIRLYKRLKRGPLTLEVAYQWSKSVGLDVSRRQLYRDLNELKGLEISDNENIKEFIDEKNKKTWKLEYKDVKERISEFDINSFFLLKNFAPYAVYHERRNSIEKIEKLIYKNISKSKYEKLIEANELYLRRTNYFENMYGEIEHRKIEDLLWALQNKRVITITEDLLNVSNLHISKDSFPLNMYPLELVFHGGRVHLGGLAVKNKQFLLFAIDKKLQFKLTNEMFKRDKIVKKYNSDFSILFGIAAPKSNKVYKIKIEFTENFGDSAKNFFFHESQHWRKLKNGNYILELECTIGREIFGFLGICLDKVKVHKPKILKDILIKKMKQVASIHENNLELNEGIANADY
jgi:predicted DNA-binding transcriptional regulator YafY